MHGGKQYKRGLRHRKPNENPQEVNISEDLDFNPDLEGKTQSSLKILSFMSAVSSKHMD